MIMIMIMFWALQSSLRFVLVPGIFSSLSIVYTAKIWFSFQAEASPRGEHITYLPPFRLASSSALSVVDVEGKKTTNLSVRGLMCVCVCECVGGVEWSG